MSFQKDKELRQLIGYAGYTGHVIPAGPNGKHLHFEVRLSGKRTNPLVWLDGDFTTKNSSVYTFGKGERSAIRSTEPSKPTVPIQPSTPQKTITFKDGRWNVRKGPGMEYGIVG
jgi:murein DD-endopeptidase MepM/ murein hydrolase activator NlpD